jgi:hypothetical protein
VALFLAFRFGFQELDNCKQRGEKKQTSLISRHSYSRLQGIRKTKECILFPADIRTEFETQYVSCRLHYSKRFLLMRRQQRRSLRGIGDRAEAGMATTIRPCCDFQEDRLCGVRVSGYITEMYCASCEVRTEFIYVM